MLSCLYILIIIVNLNCIILYNYQYTCNENRMLWSTNANSKHVQGHKDKYRKILSQYKLI